MVTLKAISKYHYWLFASNRHLFIQVLFFYPKGPAIFENCRPFLFHLQEVEREKRKEHSDTRCICSNPPYF